jgi:hypothetical protein
MTYPVAIIPSPTDIPAQSQSQIQTNFANIVGWSGVDHIQYGATLSGTHNQVTLPVNSVSAPASSPAGLASVIYTAPGVDDTTTSQAIFKNAQTNFLLSGLKAFGVVSGTTLNNSYNIASVTNGTVGRYVVTLSITLPSANYAVIATPMNNGGYPNITTNYSNLSTTQFTVWTTDTKTYNGINVPTLSFLVFQV